MGLYADTVTNLTISQNVFDHDGWNAIVPGGGATIFNHDCYLHSSNVNCVVTDNVFADAGSFGLQARAGGVVDDNLFINDPYGFAFGLVNGATTTPGGVSGEVIGNVVMEPRVDNANGWGIGAFIGNIKPGGNTVITNNIFSGEPGGNQPAVILSRASASPTCRRRSGSIPSHLHRQHHIQLGLWAANQQRLRTRKHRGRRAFRRRHQQQRFPGQRHPPHHQSRRCLLPAIRERHWSGNTYSSTAGPQSNWFYAWRRDNLLHELDDQHRADRRRRRRPVRQSRPDDRIVHGRPGAGHDRVGVPAANAGGAERTELEPALFRHDGQQLCPRPAISLSRICRRPPRSPRGISPQGQLSIQSHPRTFTVTYTNTVAINISTITSASITIAGVGGFALAGHAARHQRGSGATVTATYQVSAPSGDWTTVPNGTYVISVVGGQVKGHQRTWRWPVYAPLASFAVTVNAESPNPPAALGHHAGFGVCRPPPARHRSTFPGATWRKISSSFLLEHARSMPGFTQGVQVIPLTADATSYIDNSVAVGTKYFYELIAVNPVGQSAPTAAVSAVILPPAPVLSRVFLDDGNAARTAITSATLVFTQPVTVSASNISLIQNPAGAATPIAASVFNPSGDGKTWIVSWATSSFNNRLPDGSYSLTVHGGLITDAFGQTAGGDQTTSFISQDGPVVTATVRNTTQPPHSISMTFSQDVSASLSLTSLVLGNSQSQAVPAAGFSWNASTLTATWTYSGALPDGNYSAQLSATGVKNADGVHLDGNKDGIPGDTYTYNFTVVKPTLTISGAANVNIGGTYTLTLGAITDAGQTNPTYLVHWGDGSTSPAGASGQITHVYSTGNGPTTISVDVLDANGTHSNCASLSVSVNRATIALSGKSNANPGATYTLNLGAVTDTGFTVSSYIVHWGDGSSNTYTTEAVPPTHVYSNSGSSGISDKITVDVVDNSGAGGAAFTNLAAATLPVTVNAYPFVPTSGVLDANVGGNYTLFIGTANDPGFTVSQLSVNWGDGSAPQIFSTSTTQLTHVFLPGAPMMDAIRTTLTDNSGTYPNASVFTITVNPPPTVALSGSPTAVVGANYALTVPAANDPGQDVTLYTVNWGDGSSPRRCHRPAVFNHTY